MDQSLLALAKLSENANASESQLQVQLEKTKKENEDRLARIMGKFFFFLFSIFFHLLSPPFPLFLVRPFILNSLLSFLFF